MWFSRAVVRLSLALSTDPGVLAVPMAMSSPPAAILRPLSHPRRQPWTGVAQQVIQFVAR